jgi:hypothetical protein
VIKAADIPLLEVAIRSAFIDELVKIAEANHGYAPWKGELEKFASGELVDSLVKEAILSMLRSAGASAKRALVGGMSPQGIPMKGVLPQMPQLKGMGQRLQQTGSRMQETPLARVQRVTGQTLNPTQAAHLQADTAAAGIRGPGMAKRIMGEQVKGVGHEISHSSPLGIAFNPLGKVVGGVAEGTAKGVGKELVRSTGAAGAVGAGGLRGALGRGLQTHSGKIGVMGEVGTLGALGGLMHLPLSGTGILGTGIAKASPMMQGALAAGGDVLGHVGADAIGTAAHKGMHVGGKVIPMLSKGVGRLVGAAA